MSTKPKHTPGPWQYNEQGEIHDKDGTIIAQCYDNPDTGLESIDDEPSYFNTLLIAAAPNLLHALNRLMWVCQSADIYPFVKTPFEEAREAIAKATGGKDE